MPEIDSRDRILNAAVRLFGETGYSATSVRSVVEAAGVTKPTLYYYFESKEGLFREAVRQQLDGLQLLVGSVIGMDGTPQDRLRVFLESFVGSGMLAPDQVRLMMVASSGLDRGQPDLPLSEWFQAGVTPLRVLLEETADPDIALIALIGAAKELLFMGLEGFELPEDYATRVVRFVFGDVG